MARISFKFIIHPYLWKGLESQDCEIKNIWEIVFDFSFGQGSYLISDFA